MAASRPRLILDEPPELLVADQAEPCPYLPGRVARLPLRLPLRRLQPAEVDQRLAAGDRQHGRLLYRPACAGCQACEPIRLPLADFRPTRNLRRVLARGDRRLDTTVGLPRVSAERLELYDRHKSQRGLERGAGRIDAEAYARFLVDRCGERLEIGYRLDGRLVGVAIADLGATALSAVYCFFDPELPALSLGTYSILKQAELARDWDLSHLYLGYYVAGNRHMRYKARFLPHERLLAGTWRRFERQAPALS